MKHAYLLLEYVPGGELFTHLRKAGRFATEVARFYAGQCVLLLQYIHNQSVVFRDLKPENLLLDKRGYLKLVDFGFAKQVAVKTYTLCGTPEYVAPEMLLNRGHNRSVDWWALGVLLFEMLAGLPPFESEDPMDVYGQIIEGKVFFPKFFERGSRSLVKRLLDPEPSKRIGALRRGANDVKEHKFFSGFDWDGLYGKSLEAPIVPVIESPDDVSNYDPYPDSDEEAPRPMFEGEDPFKDF
jgi:serine/threonine protein kinase